MAYFAIPTLAGQAAIAEAIASGEPMNLTSLVVGDGAGTPVETQTDLIALKATIPLQTAERDGQTVTVEGILDENTGGFTIREAGLLDDDGQLLFVASVPPTYKGTTSEGTPDELTLGLILIVSDTATVTVVTSGGSYATINYVNEQITNHRTNIGTPLRPYWLTVDSATTDAQPATPATGACYVIPTSATGAWAAHSGKLAQYICSGPLIARTRSPTC